ncbi:hypothetical protein L3Q82_004985 [Scortum barcoo]|uniref:Uncharacterized protein n=1 Tax=Scortum barcoo TaxID=214431 RepID=A0ACB8VGS6_9TELE|nr:hypothetical protein L3Q82_004985 [Scortum barcoo]
MSHECADTGLLNLEQLLRQFLISKETLSVRMLDDSQDPTPLLKEIRDDKTATIIVDANATMSHIILERASELGMLSVYYTYIFTSLEFSLLRLDDVADQRVNIVGFSVFNKTHPFFQDFVLSLNRSWQENCDHAPFAGTPLSSALLFDAVYAVVAAVQELNRSQNVGATQLSCKSSKIWEHGTSLMNYLRMVELDGLTGHIEFNSKGQRSNYALRIMQNSKDGLRQDIIIGARCTSAHHDMAWISFSASGSSRDEYILTRSDRRTGSNAQELVLELLPLRRTSRTVTSPPGLALPWAPPWSQAWGWGSQARAPGLAGGSLPTGPGPGSARNGDVGPPSSRLTTRRKVHEGPVQCGLGSSRGRGPRRPNPWTKTLAIGTWNVTSLGGRSLSSCKWEVERYWLEIVGLTSTHSLGSGTQLLERGWTLHYSLELPRVSGGEQLVWACL